MQSMTGYGRGTATIDGRSLTVELKSVNHRFLDLNFRMPRGMMFLEDDARKQISGRVSRGHVDVFMTYKNTRSDMRRVDVDENLAGAYMQAIAKLEALGLKGDLTAMGVARMPDVLTVTEADEDQDALRQLLAEALGAALDQLVAMRVREGESMRKDLLEKAAAIEDINSRIEQRYPQTVEEYRDRLKASVMELIGQNMDESRLITEVAIMAEKSAIP